ncbi:MAG: hypothetical protein PG981_000133 [Wolbachia endosymbiont of Ctenocephalides orientis wCori]|nr:MAG: hypothetical protein PG981_000133 [Wolbachia endosymbiont of Ctenocephalides orientis wCori]
MNDTPLITFIFHYRQDLIPNLLEVISKSGRSDITFGLGSCFPKTHQAREAIEKYFTKNKDGSYKVMPYYILPIKNESQELQQCFKGIAIAINSHNLDEVKNTLGKVERTHKINVDSVNEALCVLVKKAKPSEEIALTIVKFLGDINFPTTLENTDATPPSGSIEKTSAKPPSGSIENTDATSPSGSIGRE